MQNLSNWHIVEETFPEEKLNHKETVFTIGNGYFSTRGTFEEGYPGQMATTFVHGVFNDVPVVKTELVNFPDPFSIKIKFDNEEFSLGKGRILEYARELDLSNGVLTRKIRWESPEGRQAAFRFERYANMDQIHHAALRFTIEVLNFSGNLEVQLPLPGCVQNERYQHWTQIDQGRLEEDACFLALQTTDTQIIAGISEKIGFAQAQPITTHFWNASGIPTLVYEFSVQPGDVISGVKHVVMYTSREVLDPVESSRSVCDFSAFDFDKQLERSTEVWQDLWSRSNVTIEGDDEVDRALRYNLFQILIAAPRHDETVSIGAKTLSGYGYHGHVFWDTEIFLMPFLIFTQPKIARNLLMYRYHTLPGARKKAAENGFAGVMFAWESASTGEEVTPRWVTGPDGELIRIWCGDIEQHITADIVYAICQYWKATGDDLFMLDYGAEIVLEAARFYASRLEWDASDGAYHMRNVIGPDEYHEHVDDNAFTNLMTQWVLRTAGKVGNWLKHFSTTDPTKYKSLFKGSDEEMSSWEKMADQIMIHSNQDGIIEQFNGYFDLRYLDQAEMGERDRSLQSIFGIEGVQQYQFIKQPDVVMALYLLEDQFSDEVIRNNFDYYSLRTDLSQGSSLGPSIQALMLARLGSVEAAREMLLKTLLTDLDDNRGNTADGIHAASAGAVWQVMLMGFLGMERDGESIRLSPNLPKIWKSVRLQICWKTEKIPFDIK